MNRVMGGGGGFQFMGGGNLSTQRLNKHCALFTFSGVFRDAYDERRETDVS